LGTRTFNHPLPQPIPSAANLVFESEDDFSRPAVGGAFPNDFLNEGRVIAKPLQDPLLFAEVSLGGQ
jgi:hypothetical protein